MRLSATHDSQSPQPKCVWRACCRINWKLLGVLAVMVVAAAAIYETYPTPEDVLARMWDVRTQLLEAVRHGQVDDARAVADDWSDLTKQLPRAAFVHRRNSDVRMKQACERLRDQLSDLREALQGESDRAIRQAAIECFEQHRLVAASFYVTPPAEYQVGHAEPDAGVGRAGHQHGRTEHPPELPAPTVHIEVRPDPKSGWNVHVHASRFIFAPEHASLKHVPGEGHAHLYVDGTKVARIYGAWYHLASLGPGEHHIRVTLNTNDHNDLTVRGSVVEASAQVSVPDHRMAAYFGTPQQPEQPGMEQSHQAGDGS